ncbi:MAG: transposase [Spirochaetaceae bacterium]|nr:transposase [Spirochaetaceae bacterium]
MERWTRKDWAAQIKRLVDEDFPRAEKIALVMDNLNTHNIASLYETFPADEARRLRNKKRNPLYPKAWEMA